MYPANRKIGLGAGRVYAEMKVSALPPFVPLPRGSRTRPVWLTPMRVAYVDNFNGDRVPTSRLALPSLSVRARVVRRCYQHRKPGNSVRGSFLYEDSAVVPVVREELPPGSIACNGPDRWRTRSALSARRAAPAPSPSFPFPTFSWKSGFTVSEVAIPSTWIRTRSPLHVAPSRVTVENMLLSRRSYQTSAATKLRTRVSYTAENRGLRKIGTELNASAGWRV